MECRDAQFYLRLRRHAADELGDDVTAPLTDHLATCAACAAVSRSLESFDRSLATAMTAVPVPRGLRDRLLSDVAGKQGAIWRAKLYKTGALVTAAMLVLGIGIGIFSNTRPKVDTYAMVEDADRLLSEPETTTQQWLAAQKLPDRLPLPFEYDLLVFRGFEEVQGRQVPVVVFRSPGPGTGFAKVYIFRHDGMLDLKGLQESQVSLSRAEVVAPGGKVTYVFVHTGGPEGLKPFLKNRNGTGITL
jgi:hypothetical protein